MWNGPFKNNPNGQTVSLLSKPDLRQYKNLRSAKIQNFPMPTKPGYSAKGWIQPQNKQVHKQTPPSFASPLCQHFFHLICSWDFRVACHESLLSLLSAGHRKTDISSRCHQPVSRKKPEDSSGPAATLEQWLVPSMQEGSGRSEEQQTTESAPGKFANFMKSICDSSIFRWMFKDKFQD